MFAFCVGVLRIDFTETDGGTGGRGDGGRGRRAETDFGFGCE